MNKYSDSKQGSNGCLNCIYEIVDLNKERESKTTHIIIDGLQQSVIPSKSFKKLKMSKKSKSLKVLRDNKNKSPDFSRIQAEPKVNKIQALSKLYTKELEQSSKRKSLKPDLQDGDF